MLVNDYGNLFIDVRLVELFKPAMKVTPSPKEISLTNLLMFTLLNFSDRKYTLHFVIPDITTSNVFMSSFTVGTNLYVWLASETS